MDERAAADRDAVGAQLARQADPATPEAMRISFRTTQEVMLAATRPCDEALLKANKSRGRYANYGGRRQGVRHVAPVRTEIAETALALMGDAVLLPAYVLRTEGAHFVLHIGAPFGPARTGDRAADLAATVAAIDGAITPIVVAHLDQWFMLHHLHFET